LFDPNVVEAAWPKLITAPSKEQDDREFLNVLDLAAPFDSETHNKSNPGVTRLVVYSHRT
jgi:hypothetical protein